MDDLTMDLWQGVAERLQQPEPVDETPLPVAEPPLSVVDKTGWRVFLGSRRLGAMLALACALGLLGIVGAHPFASASISKRVSDKLGQPATCTKRGATLTAGSHQTIYKCDVGGKAKRSSAHCFVVSGRDIRQVSGRRDLGC